MPERHVSGIRPRFQGLSQSQGQVTHVLLTRSPLIHPASWASPFDLHVLSTPPAFVLSQNQTLRRCLIGNHHPKAAIHRHTKRPPPAGERRSVNSAAKEAARRGRERLPYQPRPTDAEQPTPNGAATRADEPSWHQLLGTLLSSQRTDAHPPSTLCRASGRRLGSNLPEFLARFPRLPAFLRVPELYQSFSPVFTTRLPGVSDVPKPYQAFRPALSAAFRGAEPGVPVRRDRGGAEAPGGRTGGSSSAGPAIEVTLGVRSSLPGDEEIPYARRPTLVKPAARALPAPRPTWAFAPRRPG